MLTYYREQIHLFLNVFIVCFNSRTKGSGKRGGKRMVRETLVPSTALVVV
jgi:hypothetical protein